MLLHEKLVPKWAIDFDVAEINQVRKYTLSHLLVRPTKDIG